MFTRTDDENKTTEPDALKTVLRFVSDTFCRQYANIIVLGAILKLARTRLNSPSPFVAIYNFTNVRSRLGRVRLGCSSTVSRISYIYIQLRPRTFAHTARNRTSPYVISNHKLYSVSNYYTNAVVPISNFVNSIFHPPDEKIEKRGRNCTGDIVSAERLAKRRPDELGDLTRSEYANNARYGRYYYFVRDVAKRTFHAYRAIRTKRVLLIRKRALQTSFKHFPL